MELYIPWLWFIGWIVASFALIFIFMNVEIKKEEFLAKRELTQKPDVKI